MSSHSCAVLSLQSCQSICHHMDCSSPVSSIHGILQARILEWVAISFSKKAEHRRIDAFGLWCLRSLWRVPWTARGSNQSILKDINPKYSLEGLKLKWKLQYFGHLMWRGNSLEKTLGLGEIEGRRRRQQQRMRCLDSNTTAVEMSLSKLGETVKDREAWRATVLGVRKSQTQLSD